MPVTTALDKLRPLTTPEALTYDVLSSPYRHIESSGHQGFIDQRKAPRVRHAEDENFDYEMSSEDGNSEGKSEDAVMVQVMDADSTKLPESSVATESRAEPGPEATESREMEFPSPRSSNTKRNAEVDLDKDDAPLHEDEQTAYAAYAYNYVINLPDKHHWRKPLRELDLEMLRVFYSDRYEAPVVEAWIRKRKKNHPAKKNKQKAGKLFPIQKRD